MSPPTLAWRTPVEGLHGLLPTVTAKADHERRHLLQVAAILAIILLDYPDFCLILALLVMNATISYREEASADKVRSRHDLELSAHASSGHRKIDIKHCSTNAQRPTSQSKCIHHQPRMSTHVHPMLVV